MIKRGRDFFHTGLNVARSDLENLIAVYGRVPTWYENNYFVDGNVSSTGDGSINYPFSTLAEAAVVSSANIALTANRFWARRNAIWICGDDLEEDLVALPQKTDVIGCGSSDTYPMACIRGNHVPVAANYGCRFFNTRFRPAASEDLWTLASTTGGGLEFHGCLFDAYYSAFTAPSAIDTTANDYLKVVGCDFIGAFSASVIDIGPGSVSGMRIINNTMLGGAVAGILVTGTTTIVQSRLGLIDNNIIYTVGCTINDGDDDTFIITNNMLISDAATGTDSLNVDTRWCAGNWITDATKAGPWPRLDDT
jgi:hypothetical protein